MRIEKEMPANELETLYRLMMRRIEKGYTAEQLNYLIAAPYRYVEDVESAKITSTSLSNYGRWRCLGKLIKFNGFSPDPLVTVLIFAGSNYCCAKTSWAECAVF